MGDRASGWGACPVVRVRCGALRLLLPPIAQHKMVTRSNLCLYIKYKAPDQPISKLLKKKVKSENIESELQFEGAQNEGFFLK